MNTKTFLFATTLLFFFSTVNAQTKVGNSSGMSKNTAAFFNGAFQTIDNKGFSVMHDGYFNTVAEDSTGKWAFFTDSAIQFGIHDKLMILIL